MNEYDDWYDDPYVDDDWYDVDPDPIYYIEELPNFRPRRSWRLDGISAVAIGLALLVLFALLKSNSGLLEAAGGGVEDAGVDQTAGSTGDEAGQAVQAVVPDQPAEGQGYKSFSGDVTDSTLVSPYENYILTQGPHGYAYGHMAIDISGGKGAAVKSPIQGTVTSFYYDEVGNPTLVIENERYQVMLLHGHYTVSVGDEVSLGQVVGTESNQGNTQDMAGNSCRNRDCGYHTHLNLFDKQFGVNVNPLELLP